MSLKLFFWCFLITWSRVYIFSRNTTPKWRWALLKVFYQYQLHVIFPIIGNVTFDQLINVVSVRFNLGIYPHHCTERILDKASNSLHIINLKVEYSSSSFFLGFPDTCSPIDDSQVYQDWTPSLSSRFVFLTICTTCPLWCLKGISNLPCLKTKNKLLIFRLQSLPLLCKWQPLPSCCSG